MLLSILFNSLIWFQIDLKENFVFILLLKNKSSIDSIQLIKYHLNDNIK